MKPPLAAERPDGPPGGIPADLWSRAASASHRLLMLDYDGTLAPITPHRDRAVLSHRQLELLAAISTSRVTRIAVISGRPVVELARFLRRLPVALIGEHGWEARMPDGTVQGHRLSPAQEAAIARAAGAVERETWAGRLERKRTGLLLPTTGLPGEAAREMEARCAGLWAPAIAEGVLSLSQVRGGIELRAPDRHKGIAVRELTSASTPGTLPVYVGDDATDESAFLELRGTGYGLLVAAERRPSYAIGRLQSVSEVTEFLQRWRDELEGGEAPARPAAGRPE